MCLATWALDSVAQETHILRDPSSTTSGNDNDWPVKVPAADGPTAAPTRTGSILELCAVRLDRLPERLNDACVELILAAAQSQRQRLQSLASVQSEVGASSARFRADHTQLTLENQRRQGTMVFWMVLVVVALGLSTALAQFVRSFYVKEESGSAEITISNNEFKFRTTWLGALLLGMSMGFLFLYLVFVYPVAFVS